MGLVPHLWSLGLVAHLQTSDHFVACDAVPVIDSEVKSYALQVCATAGAGHRGIAGRWQVKNERLVERWVQGLLLHLRLLLANALPVVQQHYLHVRVCISQKRHFRKLKSFSLS